MIEAMEGSYPVSDLCAALDVSSAGFYSWRQGRRTTLPGEPRRAGASQRLGRRTRRPHHRRTSPEHARRRFCPERGYRETDAFAPAAHAQKKTLKNEEGSSERVKALRAAWPEQIAEDFGFIDASGVNRAMTGRHARLRLGSAPLG